MRIRMRTNLNTKKRVVSDFDLTGEYIRGIDFNNIPGHDDAIAWVNSRNFDIIDNEKPNNWVECVWPW